MENFKDHLYVVVLCGGGGTRVWPLSINKKPKQFQKFYSENTLYQETVTRAMLITDISKIIIITNKSHVDEIRNQTPQIPVENIIAEPIKRNTALAMGVAAAYVYKRDKDAVIVNLASDAVIGDKMQYVDTLQTAAKIAYEKKILMSVGIKPTFAHPGLGYIHIGDEIEKIDSLPFSKVIAFKEKPTIEVAQQFLNSGDYLWNANLYTWRADSILEAFRKYSPVISQSIESIKEVIGTDKEIEILNKQYEISPEEPIDTAISEKTDNLYVIPGDFGWNDVGGWQVVYDLGDKDENGNVIVHTSSQDKKIPTIAFDSKNNLIYCHDQPIAILGLSDIVIIDTGVGLLVCDKKQSNDVKKIVQKLQEMGFENFV